MSPPAAPASKPARTMTRSAIRWGLIPLQRSPHRTLAGSLYRPTHISAIDEDMEQHHQHDGGNDYHYSLPGNSAAPQSDDPREGSGNVFDLAPDSNQYRHLQDEGYPYGHDKSGDGLSGQAPEKCYIKQHTDRSHTQHRYDNCDRIRHVAESIRQINDDGAQHVELSMRKVGYAHDAED